MKLPHHVFRWVARTLSILLLLFWGYFLAAHLIGGHEPAPRPLVLHDYLGLATMLVSLTGLTVAWIREKTGAMLTLAAVLLGSLINWKVLLFPGILIPADALLFLVAGWSSRPAARSAK